jgi:xylulokinase
MLGRRLLQRTVTPSLLTSRCSFSSAAVERCGEDDVLIGVDSGTQSTKAAVFDRRGNLLAQASATQEVDTPADGLAEQDILSWRTGLFESIKQATAAVPGRRVAAIGLSFQRESFTLVVPPGGCSDEALQPLRPAILWLDGRADGEVAALRAGSAAAQLTANQYHELTGKPLDVTSALARMRWLAEHEPATTAQPFDWVDCGAVLSHALTGSRTTCIAGADTCGLVDLQRREWAAPILSAAGLTPAQMPRLVEPGELIGGVRCLSRSRVVQGVTQR